MKFFIDNCLSVSVVECIRILDDSEPKPEIWHLTEKYPANEKDPEWISKLRDERDDLRIITGDDNLWRKRAERKLWQSSGLTVAFLVPGWTNLPLWEMGVQFIRAWPELRDELARAAPETMFEVTAQRKTKLLHRPPPRR